MLSLHSCKICSSKKLVTIKRYTASPNLGADWELVFRSALHGKKHVTICLMLCQNCGFLFYADILSPQELALLYSAEKRYENPSEHKMKPGRRWELAMLEKFLSSADIQQDSLKTVLDIGSGDFVALERMQEILPESTFFALDPSYDQDEHQGVQVFRTMLEDFIVTQTYDLVTTIHVLEHVGDLHAFLEKVAALTHRYLYVEVPFQVGPGLLFNRSVNAQHINYFTSPTLALLLMRKGFTIKKVGFSRDGYQYNGMPGMIRILAEKKGSSGLPISKPPSVLKTLTYLINPWLLLKAKLRSLLRS